MSVKEVIVVAPKTTAKTTTTRTRTATSKEVVIDLTPKGAHTITVGERWDAYEDFIHSLVDGEIKSLIAFGVGGLGKTYTMMKVLKERRLRKFDDTIHFPGHPDYDYIVITGKSNTTELWKILYNHQSKLIIFDDCDGFLENEDSLNILKGALDGTDSSDGIITYKLIKDKENQVDIPSRFKFKGRIAFITNRPETDFDTQRNGKPGELQPLASRSSVANLSMTMDEVITRASSIILNPENEFHPVDNEGKILQVLPSERKMVIDFIKVNKNYINLNRLNMRTISSVLKAVRRYRHETEKNWYPQAALLLGLRTYDIPK